ncbi:MAG: hypothetical protein ACR2HV_01180, partial [Acidimicrobiales bacterium]
RLLFVVSGPRPATLCVCAGWAPKADTTPTTEELTQVQEGGQFCDLINTYGSRLTGLVSTGANTEQIRQLAEEVGSAIKSAEDAAPPEIKPDVTVVAAAAEGYLTALKNAGYDLAKLPPEAVQAFQAPDVAEAGVRLQGYAASVCGFRN